MLEAVSKPQKRLNKPYLEPGSETTSHKIGAQLMGFEWLLSSLPISSLAPLRPAASIFCAPVPYGAIEIGR
jgi:hypothetical protein